MALITQRILPSSLETVRDQIGIILADELANQATLNQGVDDDLASLLSSTTIWAERFEPLSENELPAIVIFFFIGDFDSKNQHYKRGNYQFYLDFFFSSTANQTDTASQIASRNSHRLAMMAHDILENPNYLKLGLPSNIVQGTNFTNIKRTEEENTSSATGVMMYRGIFDVRVTENINTITGVPLLESDTNVRIDDTDVGLQYLYEAP